jgi:hypothetical protein
MIMMMKTRYKPHRESLARHESLCQGPGWDSGQMGAAGKRRIDFFEFYKKTLDGPSVQGIG